MIKLADLCVQFGSNLMEALKAIDKNGEGILFVEKDGLFHGTLTDGDLRRALISGADKASFIGEYCNTSAVRLPLFSADSVIQESLRSTEINIIPLIDDEGVVVDFASRSRFSRFPVMEPALLGREKEYVNDCIDSNWISSQGAYVDRFEQELGVFCEADYCIATSNGTSALHLALETLGVGPGDEVIVPDLTFGASVNSIIHAGATPVLVDVCSEDWNLTPENIKSAITESTKAIMPVHLYGNPCRMAEIMILAKKHGLYVIEDCAESLGAHINGKPVGSFGDAGTFSFFANKVITCGEGGCVLFKEKGDYDKARVLRDHGMSTSKRYWHEYVGYNYRMTNIQAAIGCAQLEQLKTFELKRKAIWSIYDRELGRSLDFVNQSVSPDSKQCYWLYTTLLAPRLGQCRDLLMNELRLSGIDTRPIFYPMSQMPAFQKNTLRSEFLKHSLDVSARGISLPSSISLTEDQIVWICKRVLKATQSIKLRR